MVQLESDTDWLKRGRQRAAVAQVLQRPMTPSEIWRAAQSIATRIQLRDVWSILRQMQQRKLITCFNAKELNGKTYYWSAASPSPSPSVNWHRYACVVRSKNRGVVLLELARRDGQSASRIRRAVNERQPISLNAVIRALRDLCALRLVDVAGEGEKRGQKLYRVTRPGRRIAAMITDRTDSPQSLLNRASSLST